MQDGHGMNLNYYRSSANSSSNSFGGNHPFSTNNRRSSPNGRDDDGKANGTGPGSLEFVSSMMVSISSEKTPQQILFLTQYIYLNIFYTHSITVL